MQSEPTRKMVNGVLVDLTEAEKSQITAEQALILEEVEKAKNRKIWPTVADFWSEFTDTEKLAIADSTIDGIKLLREELRMWRGEVWSDDQRVQQGLGGLVALGILTDERKTEILTL
jgi:hypothetical protein